MLGSFVDITSCGNQQLQTCVVATLRGDADGGPVVTVTLVDIATMCDKTSQTLHLAIA
jgi:hypothetical protein